MKALSLWQPWIGLIKVGAKTIETRSWSTRYRGPLALASTLRKPEGGPIGDYYVEPFYDDVRHVEECCCDGEVCEPCARRSVGRMVLTKGEGNIVDHLPLGAVVATCNLVDVVPMVGAERMRDVPLRVGLDANGGHFLAVDDHQLGLWHRRPGKDGPDSATRTPLDGQRAYGDFRPGRFAWLLEDITPLDEPIPAKGRQGLWEWAA